MTARLTLVELDDDDEFGIGLEREDSEGLIRLGADAGIKFARGLLYGTAIAIVLWIGIGALVWAVWPR